MLRKMTAAQIGQFMQEMRKIKTPEPYTPKSTQEMFDIMIAKLGVKHYVLMGSDKTCSSNESIGTNGLGGCTCAVGFRDGIVFLAHYATLFHDALNNAINQFKPQKLFVFAHEEWKQIDGRWVSFFPDINIGTKFNPINISYSLTSVLDFSGSGFDILADAVIVRDGKITAFNKCIEY